MSMQRYNDPRRRQQAQPQPNPFEMGGFGGFGGGGGGFGQMSQMMQQMDNMMNSMGDPRQEMRSMMRGGSMMGGGGGGSLIDSMMGGSMMGGRGSGGSSYSCSSCCYSSSGGPGGQSVEYSSSSHGIQRPGQEAVHETQSNYRDSSGQEKIGVSRRIGDRGRSVVAEREADGNERRTDNLHNVQEGSVFDREWRSNASATAINDARTQARAYATQMGGGPSMLTSAFGGGGGQRSIGYADQTDSDRAAARAAGRAHEAQRERMIAEARRDREAAAARGGGAAAACGACGGGGGTLAQRPPSYRGGGGGGGSYASDAAMASRLAQQEARRAGMYR